MRKLKLQVQMTIDGFIAGPNHEMDWMTCPWTDDITQYVTNLTEPVDTILLGKNLAMGFIPHWTAALNQPEPEPGARKFVETPKVVFSKTLSTSEWGNTEIANGDLFEEVMKLKNQVGGDMIAYGGGQFVSSLLKANLMDELYLFINPAVLGNGISIFKEIDGKQDFKLVSSHQFDCGIIVLHYLTN